MSRTVMAHVEKIVNVYPIEGADRVEMCQLLDFHILVKKDEVKIGDLVIYIEVDSILPDGLSKEDSAKYDETKLLADKATGEDLKNLEAEMLEIVSRNTIPEFEFLRQKKFRIKALKYNKFKDPFGNKIVSMGIVFPLSILETIPKALGKELPKDITEGLDVTELLGIEKVVEDAEDVAKDVSEKDDESSFEKFLDGRFKRYKWYRSIKKQLRGEKIKGVWQDWMMPQSDQENIQKIFSKMKERFGNDDGWWCGSKIEGQSSAFYLKKDSYFFNLRQKETFGVCTHHRNLITDDGSQFWKTARQLDIEKRLKSIGKNIMLMGEHSGGRIQQNIYKLPEHRVYLFDVWDIDSKRYYNYEEFLEFCLKYNFAHVPVVSEKISLFDTVQEMLDHSNGTDELVPGVIVKREGLVWKRRDDSKVHFKVKSPEYMILHGK
jgi:hypothetical protein